MKKIVALAALLLLFACTTPVPAEHDELGEPDIRGKVTEMWVNYMMVEELPGEQRGEKARVAWADDTVIHNRRGEVVPITTIAVGKTVSVWYTGAVMKSYPLQATAKLIVVD